MKKIKINIRNTFPILCILLATCTTAPDSHDHDGHDDHGDHHDEGHSEQNVHLSVDQMELMGVRTGHPEVMNLSNTVQSSGRLEVPPGKRAIVGSITDGRISDIYVMRGDKVHKGQVLARLEHPDIIEMQEQYLVSRSRLAFLQAQYNRNVELFESEAISQVEFQDIESQFRAEEAIANGFKTKLRLLNISLAEVEKGNLYSSIPIVAPINGYVHLIPVQLGSYVTAEMPLFHIVDIDHIHMDLTIFEKDIHRVKKGNKVLFSLVDRPERYYKGEIFAVGRTFEEDPRILTVHAEIKNKDNHLLPGMSINTRIITDSSYGLCIPDDGVVSKGGRHFVFKLASEDSSEVVFEKLEVIKGQSESGFTMIAGKEEEITATDVFVLSGAYYLSAEMGKSELEHHH